MAISQKLHTKLVQKLILTPSLQQAIKLLPMSTLELSDLLNQEMVENPLLEEVPTEELQPAEQAQTEKPEAETPPAEKADTWDDADYEYFFGDYLDDGYRPRATCRNACCCSCGTWGSRGRPPRRSSPITCGCCRTTRCRRSRASSG
jgi:hypothetical protein